MRFLTGILFTGLLMALPVGGVQAATACGVSTAKSAAPASNYRERITRAWQPRKSGLGARLRKSSRLNPPAQNTRCATKKRPTEDERLKGQPYLTPGLFGPRKQIRIQPGGTIRRGFGSFNP